MNTPVSQSAYFTETRSTRGNRRPAHDTKPEYSRSAANIIKAIGSQGKANVRDFPTLHAARNHNPQKTPSGFGQTDQEKYFPSRTPKVVPTHSPVSREDLIYHLQNLKIKIGSLAQSKSRDLKSEAASVLEEYAPLLIGKEITAEPQTRFVTVENIVGFMQQRTTHSGLKIADFLKQLNPHGLSDLRACIGIIDTVNKMSRGDFYRADETNLLFTIAKKILELDSGAIESIKREIQGKRVEMDLEELRIIAGEKRRDEDSPPAATPYTNDRR